MSQFTENISTSSVQLENFTSAPDSPQSEELDMDFLSSAKVTVIIKCAIRMLDFICGSVGNVLMLVAIRQTPRLWTKSNRLIAALAASDLFISGPQTVYSITSQLVPYVFSDQPCDYRTMVAVGIPVQKVSYCASNSLLVGIAVDRYVAIVHPLHYETRLTEARVKMIIAFCYGFGVMVGVAHALWLTQIDWTSCDVPYSVTMQFALDFSIYVAVILAYVVVYGRILLIAIRHRKESASALFNPGSVVRRKQPNERYHGTDNINRVTESTGRKFKRREFKAARMTGLIICSFVLSWLPFHIGRGLQAADNTQQYTQNMYDIGSALGSTNVAVEWIYYGIMSKDFKQAFLKTVRYKGNRVRDDRHGSTELRCKY